MQEGPACEGIKLHMVTHPRHGSRKIFGFKLISHLALCCGSSKGCLPAPLVGAAVAQVNAHADTVAKELCAHGLEPRVRKATDCNVAVSKGSTHDDVQRNQPYQVHLQGKGGERLVREAAQLHCRTAPGCMYCCTDEGIHVWTG